MAVERDKTGDCMLKDLFVLLFGCFLLSLVLGLFAPAEDFALLEAFQITCFFLTIFAWCGILFCWIIGD